MFQQFSRNFPRTFLQNSRTEPRNSHSFLSLLSPSKIVIPRSWYRAQKPLKPGNTKKIRKNYEIPGSGPENTKKILKKYWSLWAIFVFFLYFFRIFRAPPGVGDFVMFSYFFRNSGPEGVLGSAPGTRNHKSKTSTASKKVFFNAPCALRLLQDSQQLQGELARPRRRAPTAGSLCMQAARFRHQIGKISAKTLKIGRTPRGSCNRTLLRRVLRRFCTRGCFLEGFLEGAL